MQLSTVLSDGMLALACLTGTVWLLCSRQFAAEQRITQLAAVAGLLITALAATVGSLRFAGMDHLIDLHRCLSNASGTVGLPLLALAALALSRHQIWPPQHWLTLTIALAAGTLLADWSGLRAGYGLLLTLLSLCLLLVASLFRWPDKAPISLCAGFCGLLLLAGLVVGSQGSIGPLLRVDLFHGLLVPAYLLVARFLIVLAGPERPAKPL